MTQVARETFRVGGRRSMIYKGTVFADDDPVVLDHPDLFESSEDAATRAQPKDDTEKLGEMSMTSRHRAPVEQATDAPGEKRSTRRSRK